MQFDCKLVYVYAHIKPQLVNSTRLTSQSVFKLFMLQLTHECIINETDAKSGTTSIFVTRKTVSFSHQHITTFLKHSVITATK